jgi:hypothetical protein
MALDGAVSLLSIFSYLLPLIFAAVPPLARLSVPLRSMFRLARILRVLRLARAIRNAAVLRG